MDAEKTITVWAWPVRLSHWSFAFLVPMMWYTAENSLWWWHTRLGMVLFGVLLFRISWGFAGSGTARFAQFVRGPSAVIAYLRGKYDEGIGHSPLGALGVVALLGAMSLQVGMGLFAGDPFDGATGPLNGLVGVMTADMLTDWHETFLWVVLGLVALHLSAIAFYDVIKHSNLIEPMITGQRDVAPSVAEDIEHGSRARPFIVLIICAAITVWVWLGAPPFS
ncbi:cytochrome b/b6 domain-containing protein [Qipengyuania sp. DGS5-3]|uniref:cytochrome b/b6 domain-containing protein n=1 Tax=Qipengyuania sp. DGS5-3 TaxID=3349632 RepID=UPI0036D2CBF3